MKNSEITFNNKMFGPKNWNEELIFAEENFRIEVQAAIHNLMVLKNVSYKELAKRLGTSETNVKEMFSDEFNMTVRLVGRIYHALGEQPQLHPLTK